MKNYYNILGVKREASMPEIRRAYRMLVQKLHPDVNPDPTAHERISEVNEAYDVLSDASKKQEYDRLLNQALINAGIPRETVYRYPRYRSQPGYRPAREHYTQVELMQKYLPYMLWACRAGVLFVLVLFLDRVVPPRATVDDIKDIYVVYKLKQQTSVHHILETKSGLRIKMYDYSATPFYEQSKIKIYYTPVLRIATRVSAEDGSSEVRVGIIYGALVFLPVILFATAVLGLLFKRKVVFSFNLSMVSGVLLLINLSLI